MPPAKNQAADPNAKNDQLGDEILAFVGAAPQVLIRWTPKSEGASGLAALISVQNQQQTQIDQGVARTRADLVLDISRAEIKQLKLIVPPDQKVVNVFDRNVKKWDVQQQESKQTINIELFEAALGTQNLSVELEKFVDRVEAQPIVIPQIEVVDASRNQGLALVELAEGLRAEPAKKTGLLQMDKSELPAALAKQNWRFAYRYASLPFDLSLTVNKIQPLINVAQLVEIALRPEKLTADMAITYDIQQAGVFQLLLDIPKAFEIRDIRPLARNDLAGVPVDTYYRDPANENRWIVTLSRKAMGKVGLAVSLKRELDDPNLLGPTGETSDIAITVPKVALDGIEFSSGFVVVYAPESLQINAADTKGLRNDSFANALGGQSSAVSGDPPVRPVLAYGFSHSDAGLTLQAKRRRPQVTVSQLLVVSIESGVVKYDARFFYDVRYSGVKSLRLDVPTPLVGQLRNRSSNISQQTFDPQPGDVAEGYTAWQLTGDNEFFGPHEIRYTWEEKTEELPVGGTRSIKVPRLMPMNVDRASGQIVTTKSETIDLQPEANAKGLRPIDPQTDLISGTSVDSAAMAFEFVDDWSLALTATRFLLEDLKRTSISRSVIRVVALRQNELSVQALYQVRSVDQRLAIQMPAGFDSATSFDDQPIRVNGIRVTPERGGKNLIYVPLTDQNPDQAFLLELRYTVAGNHRNIQLPTFPDDPAVQKVYLCVYLPHEQALLHQSGPWTDEVVEIDSTLLSRMFHRRRDNVQEYMNWVKTGLGQTISDSQKFETDGRPYVFTALRPEAPPAGAIHLRTLNLTLLNVIVCGAIVLIGLLLIGQRLTTQLAAAVLLLIVAVLVGIFFPLITEHVLGQPLLLTLGSVALVWVVGDAGRWIRARSTERQQRRATALALARPVQPQVVQDQPVPGVETKTSTESGDSEDGSRQGSDS